MFTALKKSVLFLFAITATGVVSCGGPKMSPRTSSIVQIIFFFLSFKTSEPQGVLRNKKNNIGLDSFSNQRLAPLNYLYLTNLCNDYPVECLWLHLAKSIGSLKRR